MLKVYTNGMQKCSFCNMSIKARVPRINTKILESYITRLCGHCIKAMYNDITKKEFEYIEEWKIKEIKEDKKKLSSNQDFIKIIDEIKKESFIDIDYFEEEEYSSFISDVNVKCMLCNKISPLNITRFGINRNYGVYSNLYICSRCVADVMKYIPKNIKISNDRFNKIKAIKRLGN